MKKLFVSLISFVIISVVSCKEKTPEIDTSLTMPAPAENAVYINNDSTAPVGAAINVPVPNSQPVTGRLNPPHGQPGHDCNIAVGAPLGGSSNVPANPGAQINTPAPVMTAPLPVLSGGVTGKINPPHGQPGHDCGVAVGAPLP